MLLEWTVTALSKAAAQPSGLESPATKKTKLNAGSMISPAPFCILLHIAVRASM